MQLLILLLVLALTGGNALNQSTINSQPYLINGTVHLMVRVLSYSIYMINTSNASGYLIAEGGSQGQYVGFLRANNYVLIGILKGSLANNEFTGYFIPLSKSEAANVPNELSEGGPLGNIAYVKSQVPVLLRYLVFNEYFNGTLVNTLPMTTIKTGNPPMTITLGNGNYCSNYTINATFTYPMNVVPMPIIINERPPISLITTSITIESTNPDTTLMLLEPGDVVYAQTPIYGATYIITVCSGLSYYNNSIGIYALEYLIPTNASFINILGFTGNNLNSTELINDIFEELSSSKYRIGPTVPLSQFLLLKVGSLIDFVTIASYVLRYYGVPSRIAFGYYGIKESGNTYVYSSSTATLWVESYTESGWIAFVPAPQTNGLPNYEQMAFYMGLSLLFIIPWILGYIIYLLLNRPLRRV